MIPKFLFLISLVMKSEKAHNVPPKMSMVILKVDSEIRVTINEVRAGLSTSL